MIPLAEINFASVKHGVPAETIEKDYVICWILKCLSESNLKKDFVFYGGTAIKRMHFENHRFSEDIDLISEKIIPQETLISELTNHLSQAKELANLAITLHPERTLSEGTRSQFFAEYVGYDEIMGAPKEIRFDFAMEMTLFGDIIEGKLFESYSDLKGIAGSFPVMTLNTILASKLGLLMSSTRNEPRDLYDIWFLLNRLEQFDFDTSRLQNAFKQMYGFPASLSVLKPHLNNPVYENRWQVRLGKQISELPDIRTVVHTIEKQLAQLLPIS